MAQWIKTLAPKLGNLSLISGTQMAGRELTFTSCIQTFTWYVYAPTTKSKCNLTEKKQCLGVVWLQTGDEVKSLSTEDALLSPILPNPLHYLIMITDGPTPQRGKLLIGGETHRVHNRMHISPPQRHP